MRPGGSHKSGVERALITVRARIRTALDALDGEALEPEKARSELDQAEKALRAVELRLSAARARPSTLLEECFEQPSADMRNWLVQNFTDVDLEAAASNFEMHSSSSSRASESGRRSSMQEQFEEVHKAIDAPEVAGILARVEFFDFDALALAKTSEANNRLNSVFGAYVVQHRGSMVKAMKEKGWVTDHVAFSQAFQAFLGKLDDLYADTQYHGAAHAVDVTATTEWLMRSAYIRERTTTLDHFMALAASALHDVGHPGKNNLFHSKTMSPLAIRYNDKSILENMHVALAFETMQRNVECNWFSLLPRDAPCQGNDSDHHTANLQQYVRKGLISMVLATDMAKHSKHVQDLASLVQELKEAEEHAEPSPPPRPNEKAEKHIALERKLFLLETVLHAADISNPCKPRHIMLGWTSRVLSEFWAQGDEERRLGLEVSPLCDRESGMASVPKGQLGFINFVVLPFFAPLAELVAEAREASDELVKNAEFWRGKDAVGATFEQIFGEGQDVRA